MFRLSFALCAALILNSGQAADGSDLAQSPLPTKASTLPTTEISGVLSGSSFHAAPALSDDSAIRGVSIDSGAVVVRGRMLQAPYVVSRSHGHVMINGETISESPGSSTDAAHQLMARVERELFDDKWVMIFNTDVIACVSDEAGMTLIGKLARAGTLSEKIKLVMESSLEGVYGVTTAEWQTALQDFQPDDRIIQQFGEYENSLGSVDENPEDFSNSQLQVYDPTRTMYGLSVVGMLLIALSAGTLLGNPPKESRKWSRVVRSPRTLTAMQRCLLLIAAYSLFDLTATLLALRTGHIEELNPLGVGLILAPTALAVFKISATCLGTGLLWRLKNYHGAQVASWWLCMVLTLVTVRWVTVQSLFFV